MGERERPEQDSINYCEKGGIRSDSQSQYEDRDDSEPRIAPQLPRRLSYVLEKQIEHVNHYSRRTSPRRRALG
jgi:hypothetical protein